MTHAPYKLTAWVDEQRKTAADRVSNNAAEFRLAEAMALHAPGMTWHELFGRGRRALLRGDGEWLPPIRAAVWSHMRRDPDPPSYPEIARACGLRSHSTIVMAVRRVQRRAAQNGGSK